LLHHLWPTNYRRVIALLMTFIIEVPFVTLQMTNYRRTIDYISMIADDIRHREGNAKTYIGFTTLQI
jgi:hypothetical protein